MESSDEERRTSKFASEREESAIASARKGKPGKAERAQKRQVRLELDLAALSRVSELNPSAENFHILAAKALREPQIHLVKNVVGNVGAEACVGLLEKTRDVIQSGGVQTADGQGCKSPGGVFFALVKESVSPEVKARIFQSDKRAKQQAKREKRRFEVSEPHDFHLKKPILSYFPQLDP